MPASGPEAPRASKIQPGDRPRTGPSWRLPGARIAALVTGRDTQGNLAMFHQRMERNAGVPLHINHREDEAFYIEEGAYLFEIGGVLSELGPGSFVFVPRGTSHRFLYLGNRPGSMLIVCQPAGIEAAFDELAALPAPVEMPQFTAVCGKYGIEVLGPPLSPR